MSNSKSIKFHIKKLICELESRRDDSAATTHLSIAHLYENLGDLSKASSWYLKAAKHIEWSEIAIQPYVLARRAAELQPNSLEARRQVERYRVMYGLDASDG
jgi:hypothetical protein